MATATDKLIEREERERLAYVQRAIERGGMPTEAEILEAEAAFRDAYNKLEAISFRLDGITEADTTELPSPVVLEHVGLIAGFASTLDIESPSFGRPRTVSRPPSSGSTRCDAVASSHDEH